ncbi:insulinase family protein [Rhodovarius crocodyli]|uniref:Insulinase family protein n=1 Tax=Rhodovarius crocodyli TaxID=1979269 RepID=A0A437MD20_9PROT|nr:pitrilysin family protein [Rhodovarius crocodyli]RVT95541.1 insulinase family protein [Rhodovarius crocodyli]
MPVTRRTAISALPLAAAIAADTPPARAQQPSNSLGRPIFGAKQWRLENGLRVVLAESHRAPLVAHYVFYGAGAGEDPQGIGGVAHFMEHMMFKGSGNVPSGDFSRLVARQGGQDNAFTSRDVTAYYQHVESSRLALVMRMEADRMAGPLFNPAEFEAERSVVLEERRQVVESQPRSKFRESFDAAMWGRQHWRGRPIIGWEEEIRAISRDDMLAFFGARYAPGNATLVVAGDVTEDQLRELVDQTYAKVPARAFTPRARGDIPAAPGMPRIEQTSPATREASFTRAIAAPSATWGEKRHAWPLEVLSHVLGGGTGSRLHKALVESGLAVSAGAGYDSDVVGAGIFTVAATLRAPNTREALEQAANAEIARIAQDGATEAEVSRSIRQLTAGAMLALDGLGAAPRMLGGALAIGLPLEDVEHWPDKLRAVTTAQVNEAARAVLVNPLTTSGWLLPA